jgi:hypothetical protein
VQDPRRFARSVALVPEGWRSVIGGFLHRIVLSVPVVGKTTICSSEGPRFNIQTSKLSEGESLSRPSGFRFVTPSILTDSRADFRLLLVHFAKEIRSMKTYARILLSILVAAICTSAFAAEPTPQSCKKSGKNCPMNDNKACNCGKKCSC